MSSVQQYKILHAGGLKCKVREGTSDEKVWNENILHPQLTRHDFLAVSPGDKWLDLGSYIGSLTLFLLAKKALVFSVEAYEPHVVLHRENIKLNGYTNEVLRAAVVADPPKSGKIDFHVAGMHRQYTSFWGSSVLQRWKGVHPVEACPAVSFDGAVKKAHKSLGRSGNWNLKIDIEGAEVPILEKADFSQFKQLFIDYHYFDDPEAKRAPLILQRLEAQGFELKLSRKIKPPKFYNEFTFLIWARKRS